GASAPRAGAAGVAERRRLERRVQRRTRVDARRAQVEEGERRAGAVEEVLERTGGRRVERRLLLLEDRAERPARRGEEDGVGGVAELLVDDVAHRDVLLVEVHGGPDEADLRKIVSKVAARGPDDDLAARITLVRE